MATCVECGKEYVKTRFTNTCSPKCYYAHRKLTGLVKSESLKRRRLEKKSLPKNVKRGVSLETKLAVRERDGHACVLCRSKENLEKIPHHVFYGGEANFGATRNDLEELVTIDIYCHHELHFGAEGHLLRQRTKEYLYSLYGHERYQDFSKKSLAFLREASVQ